MDNKKWDIYETVKNLYEDVIQKGETFSIDMGKEIQKELEKMCDRDTILTAKQAVEYGFVDEIITNKK